jgi:glutamate synthase (NADPH/NADH) large chain
MDPKNNPFDKGELAEEMLRETLPAIQGKSGGKFHFDISN